MESDVAPWHYSSQNLYSEHAASCRFVSLSRLVSCIPSSHRVARKVPVVLNRDGQFYSMLSLPLWATVN